jgi:D-apionolactonase
MSVSDRRVILFGTAAEVPPRQALKAGRLTAVLEKGNLRHIKIGDYEAIRAISYVVRDRNWGTYEPTIENLSVTAGADGFTVTYDAVCRDEEQEYRYAARIEGREDRLVFSARGVAVTDFVTNRAGFVVLHPIEGVSGRPVDVLHVDGQTERATFPSLIEPYQPFMEIRSLTHEAAPEVKATCLMEGDTFEMEDQRNWTDASYKTYVRPIGLPWPFVLPKGEVSEQSVTLSVDMRSAAVTSADAGRAVRVSVGDVIGAVPPVGLAHTPDRPVGERALALLHELRPAHLRCRFDPQRGDDRRTMAEFRELAERTGAALVLELVLPAKGDLNAEADAIARAAKEAGARFAAVIVSPAPDLKGTLPGSTWPDCPPLDEVYAAMRKAFPDTKLGGGSYCFFTELNRKQPPTAALDFITHTTCAIVHAGDDVSVMETLECMPAVVASGKAIAQGREYHIGPSAIGLPNNPYGTAPAANPGNDRIAMARMDPRQRGLLGAAWNLGFLARCAQAGVDAITLSMPVGEFGVIYEKMDYPQPLFDEIGGVYPVYHVLRGVARAAGRPLRESRVSAPRDIQALTYEEDGKLVAWLANLTGDEQDVVLEGLPRPAKTVALDAANFRAAAADPTFLDRPQNEIPSGVPLRLDAYAVFRVET